MDEAQREVAEAREMVMKDEKTFNRIKVQSTKNDETLNGLEASLRFLRSAKPDERGELTRRYAVAITELEKVVAYFKVYVTGDA
jgi:hypothetical protein